MHAAQDNICFTTRAVPRPPPLLSRAPSSGRRRVIRQLKKMETDDFPFLRGAQREGVA